MISKVAAGVRRLPASNENPAGDTFEILWLLLSINKDYT